MADVAVWLWRGGNSLKDANLYECHESDSQVRPIFDQDYGVNLLRVLFD